MTAKWNQWADQRSAGRCKEACDNITGAVVISRKCGLIHTCDNNFSKVILCRACTLSRVQPSVHFDSMGEAWPLRPFFLSLQCRDLALLIFVVFSTSEFLFFPPFAVQIMIFPEGTCTNRSCLITFKPGISPSSSSSLTQVKAVQCVFAFNDGSLKLSLIF